MSLQSDTLNCFGICYNMPWEASIGTKKLEYVTMTRTEKQHLFAPFSKKNI